MTTIIDSELSVLFLFLIIICERLSFQATLWDEVNRSRTQNAEQLRAWKKKKKHKLQRQQERQHPPSPSASSSPLPPPSPPPPLPPLFDFAFVDGLHTTEAALSDLRAAKRLSR
jgi:hypothetical protein